MPLRGQKALLAETSAGAKSLAKATEPFLNTNPVGSGRSDTNRAQTGPDLTPVPSRGLADAQALRTGGKERSRMVFSGGPRIGIALGGGSARGLTHIVYIEAMDELGLKPSIIAGTSIGALIGAGWASGMTGHALREHSVAVLGTMRIIAGRLWSTQVRGIGNLFKQGIPTQLDAMSVVDAFIPEHFPTEFRELKIPLRVVATDFQSWHQVVFAQGLLRPAIAGSIAIPSLFKPVQHAGHMLVDGGVVNPLPLDQADRECDFTIGIDVVGDPSEGLHRTDYGAIDMWFGSASIMMHSLTAHMIAAYPPDMYIRPKVASFGAMEYWRVKDILASVDGEKDRFKRLLAQRIEDYIQGRLEPVESGPR
jgi:NTE family protein